ncbi:MAG: tyrosine--tRNA ligase [Bacteroidetes bacterium]|nr:tyrosine--tRNA ligase [Bacteroidota bacterium]
MNNFLNELKWRGMLADVMPGTEEWLSKGPTAGYVGFDPTADSLHVGHLVQIMLLVHLQHAGHTPIALIGGATGMVGDPSGKSQERNLLSAEAIAHNTASIQKQMESFLDFSSAKLLNNLDWFGSMGFIDFIRDVGKHIPVTYMMAKESVKKRLETGMSFTEFTYQLLQGYDYYHLYTQHHCRLQMGGTDQWGNMTTGTELIRRKAGGEAYAFTTPLITKADGSKFGKTESGNVWLSPEKTSVYDFYQFWLRSSDSDAAKYIRIFTLKSKEEIEALEAQHALAPHELKLQRALAEDITVRVHGASGLKMAEKTSDMLFGKATTDELQALSESEILQIFSGVPMFYVAAAEFQSCTELAELLSVKAAVFSSKGEARRMIQAGGVSINQSKVGLNDLPTNSSLIQGKYLLVQKGKKNHHLLIVQNS